MFSSKKLIISVMILVSSISCKAALSYQCNVFILDLVYYLSIWTSGTPYGQNVLLVSILYIGYNKSKKSALGRTRTLVRCDIQKVLAKGAEMSQKHGKCNSREAFNIVRLTSACCTALGFQVWEHNSAQIQNILSIHKRIIL